MVNTCLLVLLNFSWCLQWAMFPVISLLCVPDVSLVYHNTPILAQIGAQQMFVEYLLRIPFLTWSFRSQLRHQLLKYDFLESLSSPIRHPALSIHLTQHLGSYDVTTDLFHSDCDCLEGNDCISFTFASPASTDNPSNTKLLQAAFRMQVVKGRGVPRSGLSFVTFYQWNWWNFSLFGPSVFSQDESSTWRVVCRCWRDKHEWDIAVSFKVVTAQSEINQ